MCQKFLSTHINYAKIEALSLQSISMEITYYYNLLIINERQNSTFRIFHVNTPIQSVCKSLSSMFSNT